MEVQKEILLEIWTSVSCLETIVETAAARQVYGIKEICKDAIPMAQTENTGNFFCIATNSKVV